MNRVRSWTSVACLAAAANTCAALVSGCVGVTRMPARANGPTGAEIQKNELDLAFLKAGTTRREEVTVKLSRIDTGLSNSRIFWGRWSESKWGHWLIIAGPGGAAGNAGRDWHIENLLVHFDASGLLQTNELIDSQRRVEHQLRALLAEAPTSDLWQPVTINLKTHSPGRPLDGPPAITLAKDGLLVGNNVISPLTVARISYERFYGSPRTDSICHSLHFIEKTRLGKKFMVCTTAADLATLLDYLQRSGSPKMRWE